MGSSEWEDRRGCLGPRAMSLERERAGRGGKRKPGAGAGGRTAQVKGGWGGGAKEAEGKEREEMHPRRSARSWAHEGLREGHPRWPRVGGARIVSEEEDPLPGFTAVAWEW